MTGRDLFEIWAPDHAVWSQWVSPALFAQIDWVKRSTPIEEHRPEGHWHERTVRPDAAVVIDLPGAESIRLAFALAQVGYRPVPIINASPGPAALHLNSLVPSPNAVSSAVVALDMTALLGEICRGPEYLQKLTLAHDAPPAFILDSLRLKGTNPLRDDIFDNRWMVFPQDFPSAKFLGERKISRVILVQGGRTQPQEDLSHVLLRWQEAGIEILAKSSGDATVPRKIFVSRPSRFRASWYRALAIMGLRRSSVGGFGSFIPETFSAG